MKRTDVLDFSLTVFSLFSYGCKFYCVITKTVREEPWLLGGLLAVSCKTFEVLNVIVFIFLTS